MKKKQVIDLYALVMNCLTAKTVTRFRLTGKAKFETRLRTLTHDELGALAIAAERDTTASVALSFLTETWWLARESHSPLAAEQVVVIACQLLRSKECVKDERCSAFLNPSDRLARIDDSALSVCCQDVRSFFLRQQSINSQSRQTEKKNVGNARKLPVNVEILLQHNTVASLVFLSGIERRLDVAALMFELFSFHWTPEQRTRHEVGILSALTAHENFEQVLLLSHYFAQRRRFDKQEMTGLRERIAKLEGRLEAQRVEDENIAQLRDLIVARDASLRDLEKILKAAEADTAEKLSRQTDVFAARRNQEFARLGEIAGKIRWAQRQMKMGFDGLALSVPDFEGLAHNARLADATLAEAIVRLSRMEEEL